MHGPLPGLLMLELVRCNLPGRQENSPAYRLHRPAFAGEHLHVGGVLANGRAHLHAATARADGRARLHVATAREARHATAGVGFADQAAV